MTQKIIFLKGLPASGKTTYALKYVEEHPNTIRASKDDIREKYHKGVYSKENEKEVLMIQFGAVVDALHAGKDVIIDNTHLFSNHEEKYRGLAESFNIDFEVVDTFLSVSIAECVLRDSKREKPVGEKVIRDMAKNAGIRDKEVGEFAEVTQNNSLPPCIIVDIDGTIAKMEGRSPYDYTRVLEDSVHWDVVKLIEYYLYGYENELCVRPHVIIVSGRKAICKEDTEQWFKDKVIPYDKLYMRKTDDTRNDAIVKWEILQEIIKTNRVVMVFDDRERVVKMFRECGLRTMGVANGNF